MSTVGERLARTGQFFSASSRDRSAAALSMTPVTLEAQGDADEPEGGDVVPAPMSMVDDQVAELLALLPEDDDHVVGQAGGQGQGEEIRGLGPLDLGVPADGQAEAAGVLALEETAALPDQALVAGGHRFSPVRVGRLAASCLAAALGRELVPERW